MNLLDEFLKFTNQTDNSLTFLQLRQKVINSGSYSPFSNELENALELGDKGKHKQAINELSNSFNNLFLSPRMHFYLAFFYQEIGEFHKEDKEIDLGNNCLEGLLSTGDGTESAPYLVLRTEDEHDIIHKLNETAINQTVINKDNQHFDIIECANGRKYWFNASDIFKHPICLNE